MIFARQLSILAALAWGSGVVSAQQNQLDGNKTLFAVMAAMNAAGFDYQADSGSNLALRREIRDEILRRKPESLDELRRFRLRQRFDDPTLEYRMYAGYALLVKGAPNFELRMLRNELPPDVALMEDLGPVFAKFYREAAIEELWQKSQPVFDFLVEQYHQPVLAMVQKVNAYLRVPSGAGYLGKTFQIVVDPLGPPNQIQLHTFYDNYYLVVSPSVEPQVKDARRAYLHYLLDPMTTQAGQDFRPARPLGEYVQGAPVLGADFKADFLLLVTRSLIRAMEARFDFAGASARTAAIDTAMKEGFILTEHFADQLPAYEKQELAMKLFLPEMAKAIDLAKEERRVLKLEFTEKAAVRVARQRTVEAAAAPVLTGFAKRLDDAEELYRKKDMDAARAIWLDVAEKAPEKPVQAKAYYGLGRIALLNRNPELAEQLFERILTLDPEDAERAWAHVYIGKLEDLAGEATTASAAFEAALKVPGITETAKREAQLGLTKVKEQQKK